VFDFGQTEGGALYIAMELLDGQDLNALLGELADQGKTLDQAETIRIAVQVLRSLAEAHMVGLVHRDLKPHNIFLNQVPGDESVVKVLDFGIAKRLGTNLTGTGQSFGTPAYMSPEQAQNKPIDGRSDLYSLGVVLYHCVTGRCPFVGENPLAVMLSHVSDPPPNLRQTAKTSISDGLVAVIEKALSKQPADRFESAIEMRQVLVGLSTQDVTPSMPSTGSNQPVDAAVEVAPAQAAESESQNETFAYSSSKANQAKVSTNGAGSGMTEGFLANNDKIEDSAIAAEDTAKIDSPSMLPSKGKLMVLLGLGLVLSLSAIALLVFRPGQDEGPKPEHEVTAEGAVTALAQAGSSDKEAGPDVVLTSAQSETDAATTSPDTVQQAATLEVALTSIPVGAKVDIEGKTIGRTPLSIELKEGQTVQANLKLLGYREVDVLLSSTDGDGRTIKLTPTVRAKVTERRRKPVKPVKKKVAPRQKSELEELL
jgi:hypothetical protein